MGKERKKLRCGHVGTIENPYFQRGKGLSSEMGVSVEGKKKLRAGSGGGNRRWGC